MSVITAVVTAAAAAASAAIAVMLVVCCLCIIPPLRLGKLSFPGLRHDLSLARLKLYTVQNASRFLWKLLAAVVYCVVHSC